MRKFTIILKLIFILFVIQLVFLSCKTNYGVVEPLIPVTIDLFNNPDKINNLEREYPEFYNTKFIHERLKDSAYKKVLISITKDFSKLNNKIQIEYLWYFFDFIDYKKNGESVFIKLRKGKRGLSFSFLCIDNKFFLEDIGYLVEPNPAEN